MGDQKTGIVTDTVTRNVLPYPVAVANLGESRVFLDEFSHIAPMRIHRDAFHLVQ